MTQFHLDYRRWGRVCDKKCGKHILKRCHAYGFNYPCFTVDDIFAIVPKQFAKTYFSVSTSPNVTSLVLENHKCFLMSNGPLSRKYRPWHNEGHALGTEAVLTLRLLEHGAHVWPLAVRSMPVRNYTTVSNTSLHKILQDLSARPSERMRECGHRGSKNPHTPAIVNPRRKRHKKNTRR